MTFKFQIFRKKLVFWRKVHEIELVNYGFFEVFQEFKKQVNRKKLDDGTYRVISDYNSPMKIVIEDGKISTWSYEK